VARGLYKASLALTPLVLAAHYALAVNGTVVFALAALALMPLAFLIGEATEHVAEHTGARIGGFLNASFGNAPELLIALFAINDSLPNVVRGTLAGSVVSTGLLVLGGAIAFGGGGGIDRSSLLLQTAVLGTAVVLFLVPSVAGWSGDPDRHSVYLLTLPPAAILFVLYVLMTVRNLRGLDRPEESERPAETWSMRTSLTVLAVATLATAFVSDALVGSLDTFVDQLGLSQFFVAVVIVALVGNAAEHGGAIVTARRGNSRLGAEIAVSSATQVAVLVAPVIALLSGLFGRGLALSFRPIELGAMAATAAAVAVVIYDRQARRWEGFALAAGYALAVTAFWLSGDR
jgi:Ca2+:H+ antiporter